ncbi:22211_t:CDS:1, partial [Gigaspora margarita]
YHVNASAQLNGASFECFPKIDNLLKEYLTEELLSHQRHEVIQLLYYYFKIKNDQSLNIKPIEEEYDAQQIHLNSFFENIPQSEIIKIYINLAVSPSITL